MFVVFLLSLLVENASMGTKQGGQRIGIAALRRNMLLISYHGKELFAGNPCRRQGMLSS